MHPFLSRAVTPLDHLRRRWKRIALLAIIASAGIPLLCDYHITSSATGRCHTDLNKIGDQPLALLLGTAREFNGARNGFYTKRIEAAAALFKSGKVRGILASGDNGRSGYDEPSDMKADLVAAGVPEEFITLDYAGFRTRDSIVRAKKVFGQTNLIIVSQRFHAERALYIAQELGLGASAFVAADSASRASNARVRIREILARTMAVADNLIDRQPKFLGKPELVALRD